MAEAGELEEDLFADLYVNPSTNRGDGSLTSLLTSYDADESTNRTTSAVEAPKPTDVDSAVPSQPAEVAPAQSYDYSAPETHPSQIAPQPDYGSYQNGSGSAAAPAAGAPADNGSQGTGIKEDG